MKKLIEWIRSHVWQSVVIGVVLVGAVACSITLPIVLSKNDEPVSENDSEPGSGPVPVATTYTISVVQPSNGTLECEEGQFELGKQITVIANAAEGYSLKEIKVNGECKSNTSPYQFIVSEALADTDRKIVVSASFEQDGYVQGIEIQGSSRIKVGETLSYTVVPTNSGGVLTDSIVWSIVEGNEYIHFSNSDGNPAAITGQREGTAKIIALYDGMLYSPEFTINVEF